MNQLTTMSQRLELDESELNNILVKTVMPAGKAVSTEQFTSFVAIANEYQLNPLAKEIYAFPAKGGGIQPIVSIDGWLKLINTHEQFNGMQIEFSDRLVEHHGKQVPDACTVRMWRKDREKPVVITEYLDECARNTDPWKEKPRRMLQHKTVIQAARYAFSFSGIMDEDEAQRVKDMGTVEVIDEASVVNKKPAEEIDTTAIYNMLWDTISSIDLLEDISSLGESFKDPNSDYKKLSKEDQQKIRRLWRQTKLDLEDAQIEQTN